MGEEKSFVLEKADVGSIHISDGNTKKNHKFYTPSATSESTDELDKLFSNLKDGDKIKIVFPKPEPTKIDEIKEIILEHITTDCPHTNTGEPPDIEFEYTNEKELNEKIRKILEG